MNMFYKNFISLRRKWIIKLNYLLVLSFFLVLFSGCVSIPSQERNMIPDLTGKNIKYNSALQNAIQPRIVTGGHKTHPLWVSKISNKLYKNSLTATLANLGLLNNSENANYYLDANIVSLKQDLFGLNMKVILAVEYTLTNKNIHKPIAHNKKITSFCVGKVQDSLIASNRLRLATECAAKYNIEKFMVYLSQMPLKTG